MNQQILELARESNLAELYDRYQSYCMKNADDDILDFDEVIGKFAELIVRECAKFLDENSGYDDCNNAWHPEPEDLLKHFGI